ncbi:SpoIIE family protein phosphatase [Desulfovibrio sp. OttesenSCG-928-F20]|nr:SpoIIE family protein phosphatase [Desulfovibrio sp. OttesenSCG-928-F20]
MLWSIRTRLTLTCLLLVLLTAAGLMWFAHKDTIRFLRLGERRGLDNVLYLLESELAAAHADSLYRKVESVEEYKRSLRLAAEKALALLRETAVLSLDEENRSLAMWSEYSVNPDITVRFYQQDYDGETPVWTGLVGGRPAAYSFASLLFALPVEGEGEFAYLPEGDLAYALRADDLAIVSSRSLNDIEQASTARLRGAGERFTRLLSSVRVQKTGYAAVIDNQGKVVAAPKEAIVPERLLRELAAGGFAGAARRVMVLPANDEPDAPELLFLLGYFPPLGWNMLLCAPLDELEAPAHALISDQLIVTLCVLGIAVPASLALALRIAGPIRRLSRLATALPQQDMLALDTVALTDSLPLKRKDEVGELARSFGHMAKELHRNITELVESTALRQRLEKELQVAKDIQFGMLPTVFPKRDDLDLFAGMRTAKEVGGDLYDFFFADSKRLCFLIGDVSDKSVPAALFMSRTVTLARAILHGGALGPDEAMVRINDSLSCDNPRNMFVTLCLGYLHLDTGELEWAGAGHMPPIKLSVGRAAALDASLDMVAGSFEGLPYKLMRDSLAPGDSLLLYTDGVSEAMNHKKELFGNQRMLDCLEACRDLGAAEMAGALFNAVEEYADGQEQSDDIALMVIRYLGQPT